MHPNISFIACCVVAAVPALAADLHPITRLPAADPDPDPISEAPSLAAAVNPVTGTATSIETLRRRLAEAQLQARLEAELTSIERARIERRRLGAESFVSASPSSLVVPSPTPVTPRPARVPIAPRPAPVAAQPTVSPPSAPRLLGVLRDGDAATAIVEIDGHAKVLASGETDDGVRVGAIHADSAQVNDHWQNVPTGPLRIALPATQTAATSKTESTVTPVASAPATSNDPFPGLHLGGEITHHDADPAAAHP